MNKGQTQVVSALIVVVVTLAIVGSVFPWASSVIQKKRDAKSVDDIYNFFIKLERTVIEIGRNGGEEALELKVPGRVTVYPESSNDELNNSIIFEFRSKVSYVAESDSWIPLNTPNSNLTATLGIDKSGIVLAKASKGDDYITVWYRVWFRELEDKTTGKSYKIALKTSGDVIKTSEQGFFRIQKLDSEEVGNLIKTQVNIIV